MIMNNILNILPNMYYISKPSWELVVGQWTEGTPCICTKILTTCFVRSNNDLLLINIIKLSQIIWLTRWNIKKGFLHTDINRNKKYYVYLKNYEISFFVKCYKIILIMLWFILEKYYSVGITMFRIDNDTAILTEFCERVNVFNNIMCAILQLKSII